MKLFPVLNAKRDGCAEYVPWDKIDAKWAMKLHGQTLERLAERGGLCAYEIACNWNKLKPNQRFQDAAYPARLVNNLAKS